MAAMRLWYLSSMWFSASLSRHAQILFSALQTSTIAYRRTSFDQNRANEYARRGAFGRRLRCTPQSYLPAWYRWEHRAQPQRLLRKWTAARSIAPPNILFSILALLFEPAPHRHHTCSLWSHLDFLVLPKLVLSLAEQFIELLTHPLFFSVGKFL